MGVKETKLTNAVIQNFTPEVSYWFVRMKKEGEREWWYGLTQCRRLDQVLSTYGHLQSRDGDWHTYKDQSQWIERVRYAAHDPVANIDVAIARAVRDLGTVDFEDLTIFRRILHSLAAQYPGLAPCMGMDLPVQSEAMADWIRHVPLILPAPNNPIVDINFRYGVHARGHILRISDLAIRDRTCVVHALHRTSRFYSLVSKKVCGQNPSCLKDPTKSELDDGTLMEIGRASCRERV